jgi:bifunctional DNA-binding transcriptional regulator/antitoxin component of YhaV-PrlF toxin-antitoxin module
MGFKTTVTMNADGRLTVPAAVRRLLQVEGQAAFELEVTDSTLILRPAPAIPSDDAWLYTPETLQRIEEARRDAREGRVRRMSEAELERLLSQ